MLVNPGILHSASLAKYAVAFLRNTINLLQGKTKLGCPTVEILDDPVTIVLFVVIGPSIGVG
jgi:hypothetical protein